MRASLAGSLALALLSGACTKKTQSSIPLVPPQSAVHAAMTRQVANAQYAGEGDPTVRSLQKRIAAEPANLARRLELATLYENSGHPELAVEHYRSARRQQPESEEILLRTVRALEAMRLPAAAIEEIQEYRLAYPGQPAANSKLGILLDNADQHAEAEAAHRRALQASPQDSRLHNNLGYCLLLQKRYAEAAAEFRVSLELSPWSETARNNLALALASDPKSADTRDAIAHWSSTNSPAAAHNNLAAVYIERRQWEQARQEIAIALSYQKGYPPALRNLQLISDLDGGPASVQVQPHQSSWRRLWTGVKRAFVTTEEPVDAKADSAANRE